MIQYWRKDRRPEPNLQRTHSIYSQNGQTEGQAVQFTIPLPNDPSLPLKPPKSIKTPLKKIRAHKFYAVASGRTPGIYTSWPITQAQVHGFSGALFQGFTTYAAAQEFLYLYSTGLTTKDRHYLPQITTLPTAPVTTNVNVHINTPSSHKPPTAKPPLAHQHLRPSSQTPPRTLKHLKLTSPMMIPPMMFVSTSP
jgi:hypothetical protein